MQDINDVPHLVRDLANAYWHIRQCRRSNPKLRTYYRRAEPLKVRLLHEGLRDQRMQDLMLPRRHACDRTQSHEPDRTQRVRASHFRLLYVSSHYLDRTTYFITRSSASRQ